MPHPAEYGRAPRDKSVGSRASSPPDRQVSFLQLEALRHRNRERIASSVDFSEALFACTDLPPFISSALAEANIFSIKFPKYPTHMSSMSAAHFGGTTRISGCVRPVSQTTHLVSQTSLVWNSSRSESPVTESVGQPSRDWVGHTLPIYCSVCWVMI